MVSNHPILGVTVIDEDTVEPKWVRLETIDLTKIVSTVEADPNSNLDMAVEEGHRMEFDQLGTLPLWRIIVAVQESKSTTGQETLSFAIGYFFHHAIGDGISGAAFHLSFLDALNNVSHGLLGVTETTITVPKTPLLPTIEMSVRFPLSIWFTVKMIFTTFVYSREDPLHWWGPLVTTTPPQHRPTVKVRSFSLPYELVVKLVAQCRKEATTVTALFSVLVARKFALMYPSHSRFTGSIPFSLRKVTGHTVRDMGCFLSGLPLLFSSESKLPSGYISCASDPETSLAQDTKLWESARASKALIISGSSSTVDQPIGLLKFVKNDYKSYFLGMLGKNRDCAFEVTNIGVVDGGADSEHGKNGSKATFDQVVFSASTQMQGYPYSVLIATAKNGSLTSTLCWDDGVMEDEEAHGLSRWLEKSIREVVGA